MPDACDDDDEQERLDNSAAERADIEAYWDLRPAELKVRFLKKNMARVRRIILSAPDARRPYSERGENSRKWPLRYQAVDDRILRLVGAGVQETQALLDACVWVAVTVLPADKFCWDDTLTLRNARRLVGNRLWQLGRAALLDYDDEARRWSLAD